MYYEETLQREGHRLIETWKLVYKDLPERRFNERRGFTCMRVRMSSSGAEPMTATRRAMEPATRGAYMPRGPPSLPMQ